MRNCLWVVLLFVFVTALSAHEERSDCQTVLNCKYGTFNTQNCVCDCQRGWYGKLCDSQDQCVYNGPVVARVGPIIPASCGQRDGNMTFTINGGVSPFAIFLNHSFLSVVYSSRWVVYNLTAANYSWGVYDSHACNATGSTIIPLKVLIVSLNTTMESCNGASDGSVSFNASGGSGVYKYKIDGISGWTSQMTFKNLHPGTYNYSVQDNKGCAPVDGAFVIASGANLSITMSELRTSCYSQASGSATFNVVGGTLPYSVYIDNNRTGNSSSAAFTSTSLSKGFHSLLVTDASSCYGMLNLTVPNYDALTVQVVQKHDSCNMSDLGSVTLAPSGGTGSGYQYSIDGSSLTGANRIDSLSVGQHYVSVTDGQQCSSGQFSFSIAQLQPLAMNYNAPYPSCPGGYTNLTVSASGASNDFTYWIGGVMYTSNVIPVLAGSRFSLEVHDSNGCEPATASVTILDLSNLTMGTVVQPSGCSVPSGTMTLSATGGTAPYTYSFDGMTFSDQTAYTSLVGGTYQISAKDSHECPFSKSVTITLQGSLMANPSTTDLLCSDSSTGSINVVVTGGIPPYSYNINGTYQPIGFLSGLAAGTYSIDVKDAAACVYHLSAVVMSPQPLALDFNFTNPVCSGHSSGTITLLPTGGVGIYNYSLNGATAVSTPVFTNLQAGAYQFTVTDVNGCQTSTTVTLSDPESIQVTAQSIPSSWCGSTGALIFTTVGGSGGFEYSLGDTFSTNNTIADLAPGNFTVNVRDAKLCPATVSFTVPSSQRVQGEVEVSVWCDGTATATFLPTNYNLESLLFSLEGNSIVPSNVFGGLTTASQTMIVYDAFGCQASFPFNFVPLPAIVAIPSVVNATCFGGGDGEVWISASGGMATFTYSIDDSPPVTSPVFTGLRPGDYKFLVNDSRCTFTSFVTVDDTSAISMDAYKVDLDCNDARSGAILISSVGGTAPYTFSLDGYNYFSNPNITGLAKGNYTYYVKDSFNCTASSTVSLTRKALPQAEAAAVPVTCASPGVVTLTPSDSETYSYSLDGDNFTSSSIFRDVKFGNHTWRVMDSDGCVATGQVAVDQIASGCDNHTTCYASPIGPACTACPSGYTGTGSTGCIDIDECAAANNCTTQETCVNAEGSYSCVARPMAAVVTCAINNGGCAYSVKCTQLTLSTVSCGSCPFGTVGNGSLCTSLCGDGKCDANASETCVSCPSDCPSPCGLCGDGECSVNESCSSCYQDCGVCKRDCPEGCGINGICLDGQCVCSGFWSGPSCTDNNQELNVQVDSSSPSLAVTSIVSNTTMNVSLSISSISEYSSSGEILRSVFIPDYTFSYSTGNVGPNEQYNVSTVFENGATLNVTIWLFKEQHIIEFANTSTLFLPNTVKMSIMVQNWPFLSVANYLGIVTDSKNLDETSSTQVKASVDEQGNLKWLKIVVNGIVFYGQFLDKAVLDGHIRTIRFTLNTTDNTITTIVPHFWSYADIDPNYSVLLDSKPKSTSTTTGKGQVNAKKGTGGFGGMSKTMLIGVAVAVGTIFIGVIFACFAAPKIRVWWKVRQTYRNPGYRSSMEFSGASTASTDSDSQL